MFVYDNPRKGVTLNPYMRHFFMSMPLDRLKLDPKIDFEIQPFLLLSFDFGYFLRYRHLIGSTT